MWLNLLLDMCVVSCVLWVRSEVSLKQHAHGIAFNAWRVFSSVIDTRLLLVRMLFDEPTMFISA